MTLSSDARPIILGIESSCDETAAAVVASGRTILSSVVSSQIDIHRKFGGVVPELASREHLRQIVPVVREALEQASVGLADLDAVAVTQGPGLVGALLVGITYGKALASGLGKPLIPVNHLEGHIHAVFLEAHSESRQPELPAVCLIVSGGHTILYSVDREAGSPDDAPTPPQRVASSIHALAAPATTPPVKPTTKSPACSALGYPGGPVIDQLAAYGNPEAVRFNDPKMSGNRYDFSFSGIKTAMLYHLRRHPEFEPEIAERKQALARGERQAEQLRPLCSTATLDLIASFQNAVVNNLVSRIAVGGRTVPREIGVGFGRSRSEPAASPDLRGRSAETPVGSILSQPTTINRQRRDDRGGGLSEVCG